METKDNVFLGGLSPDDLEGPMFENVVKSVITVVSRPCRVEYMKRRSHSPFRLRQGADCSLWYPRDHGSD